MSTDINPDYIRRRDAAMANALAIVESAALASYAKYPPRPMVYCATDYLSDCGAADTPILGINTVKGLR